MLYGIAAINYKLIIEYNGNKQDTTCSVTPPKVTASSNTPDFLGWNLNSNDHKNYTNYNLDNNVLTLSEDISGNTWYAITEKKEVYYNVNYKINKETYMLN